MNRLLDIGFELSGHWFVSDGRLDFKLARNATRSNILYAFVNDGEVLYVGKTVRTLSMRMSNYRRPSKTQSTNISNNGRIRALLDVGDAVDILSLPDSGLIHYGKFHLNLAAGLEDSIIRTLDPPWNGGKVEPVTEQLALDELSTEPPIAPEVATSFPFTLQSSYKARGFFNVPVGRAALFGADGATIEMFLGEAPQPVLGGINRTANINGSPRILGGRLVRDWFATLEVKTLQVEVMSPTAIRITTGNVQPPT